jgi:hypothetical protein
VQEASDPVEPGRIRLRATRVRLAIRVAIFSEVQVRFLGLPMLELQRVVDVPYQPEHRDDELRPQRRDVFAVDAVLMLGSAPGKTEIQDRPTVKAMPDQGGELSVRADARSDQQRVPQHRDVDAGWPGLEVREPA